MNKIKINKKILTVYSIIYLLSILITYSYLEKIIKPVYELNFSISSKNPYEIELLIGNDYREKKKDFLDSLISKYQNSDENLYLNDFFSARILTDFNSKAIANTAYSFAISMLSDVEKFKTILEKCNLSNNIKNVITNNLFVDNMFNFDNFNSTRLISESEGSENTQFAFIFKEIGEKELQRFINEFKKTIEQETLNYAKKLFLIEFNIQYLKESIEKEITKIPNDEKVINFYIDRIANRTLNKNLAVFLSLLLPIIVILSIELLRLLVLNRINFKHS